MAFKATHTLDGYVYKLDKSMATNPWQAKPEAWDIVMVSKVPVREESPGYGYGVRIDGAAPIPYIAADRTIYAALRGAVKPLNPPGPTITLERVRLNRQGYTSGGTYYGVGAPLFSWSADWPEGSEPYAVGGGSTDGDYMRAADRADAKAKLRAKFPNARFGR